jgi:hypothetical protein
MEMSDGRKHTLIFGGALIGAGLVLSTIVFPFWNLIREDVVEDVVILNNEDGICYVETQDQIPKTIRNCENMPGDTVTIKFGRDLAWAEIIG